MKYYYNAIIEESSRYYWKIVGDKVWAISQSDNFWFGSATTKDRLQNESFISWCEFEDLPEKIKEIEEKSIKAMKKDIEGILL